MSELSRLELLLKRGKLSRREFLARLSALGLTAAVSPVLLTSTARASTPKKGGRLRLGTTGGETADSLDPRIMNNTLAQLINSTTRNHLVELDATGNAIPELAESWEVSPDAMKWFFKLRRGVEFHNGKTLTAEDVVFSINLHRGEETKSSAKGLVDQIADIKVDGKYNVAFTLKGGNADFPFILLAMQLPIVPAESTYFDDGLGTGPYILKDWEPGVRAYAKRNPNYWKKGRAHFDEVEILGIADSNARTAALKTGEIDAINKVNFQTAQFIEKTPGIKVVRINGTMHFNFPMRTDIPPHNNNDVRLGLKYAIDRENFVKMILSGYGTPGNDHPITPANRYYAHEIPIREYDPDKARFHLKKAGMLDHTFELHASEEAFPGAVSGVTLYKEHAAKAGINIKPVRVPSDGYYVNTWRNKPWCSSYWYGRPTEDMMFSTAYAAGAPWNETFWNHDRFNELLKAGRAELDEAKRRQIFVEMQKICRDEGGVVTPCYVSLLLGATNKLNYQELGTNFDWDGLKIAERWWFES